MTSSEAWELVHGLQRCHAVDVPTEKDLNLMLHPERIQFLLFLALNNRDVALRLSGENFSNREFLQFIWRDSILSRFKNELDATGAVLAASGTPAGR